MAYLTACRQLAQRLNNCFCLFRACATKESALWSEVADFKWKCLLKVSICSSVCRAKTKCLKSFNQW